MAVIALSTVGASARGDLVGYAATEQGQLLELLRLRGHRLVEPDSAEATDFVALDHNAASLALVEGRVPRERRQLVVFEPRVVKPANYHRGTHRRYGAIIPMTPAVVAEAGSPRLPWPQRDWRVRIPTKTTRVPGSTVLINANKLSMVRGSLYGLRRRIIEAFSREGLPLILAGSNWARPARELPRENARALAYAIVNHELVDLTEWAGALPLGGSVDYVGIVDDKEALMAQAEFAVVVENSATYISEKLFDAVIAGCVPLYVGPALSSLGIPDGVAVQLGAHARATDFTNAVRTLTQSQKTAVLDSGRDWLADDSTYTTWAMPYALERLAEAIHQNIVKETAR